MSGRGQQKGRGTRKFFNKGSQNPGNKPDTKKTITDYSYHLGTAKQANDFESTTEFIINHIMETYEFGEDIGTALKELDSIDTDIWLPTLKVSKEKDDAKKENQDRQYGFQFQEDYKEYKQRCSVYRQNMTKAYALLWGRCAKGMKSKIEARADFQTKTSKSPIDLLIAIKEHALNYQENKYPSAIVHDSIMNLLSAKQNNGESLQDYTKRFKNYRDVMESQLGGPLILTKMMESIPGYNVNDPDKVEECQGKAYKQFLAYVYLHNSDHTKYGTLISTLSTQHSLGNDQYPKNITETNAVLSNHKFDPTFKSNQKKQENKGHDNQSKSGKTSDEQEVNLSFAQLEGKCYCCGKAGHKSPQCRQKDKPKDQWAINKAKTNESTFVQSSSNDSTAPSVQQSQAGGGPPSGSSVASEPVLGCQEPIFSSSRTRT
jgi:hypothetical protein